MNEQQVSDVIPASERPDSPERIPEAEEFKKIAVYRQNRLMKIVSGPKWTKRQDNSV